MLFSEMKCLRTTTLCVVRGRAYSARAAAKQVDRKTVRTPEEVKVSRLPNRVVAVSLDTYSPISNLAVIYNAGPRFEAATELGLTHCVRVAVTQSTEKATAFGIAKNLQQIGATLTCTTTREQMIYSLQCLRNQFSNAVEYFSQVASGPSFKPWELDDAKTRVKLDLDVYNRSLDARLMDALHKAVYRDTLGQSLYMSPDRVGSYSPELLETFVRNHYVPQNTIVVGVGLDHDKVVHAARKLSLNTGAVPAAKTAKYHGGAELRVDVGGNVVHAAIVTEGVHLGSSDVVPAYVLQQALSGLPCVQYGLNASSRLNKAAMSVTNQPFAVNCMTLNYSDSGLFGIRVVTGTMDIGKVLRAVINSMSQTIKTGITDAEVQRAKARTKALLQLSSEDAVAMVESLGSQASYTDEPLTASQLAAAIDSVTIDDVNKVAKKLTSGKPTMAAVGNLVNTPYLDELI